jgi:hypothetical protein
VLFIYIPEENSRIKYVFNYIFNDYLKIPFTFLNAAQKTDSSFPILSYKTRISNESLHFGAHSLLFEKCIQKQTINCFQFKKHTVFFETEDSNSALPYDPFALVFFMLSRYEEYGEVERDVHGRFPASVSIAVKNNFILEPIVDQAIEDIRKCIEQIYPNIIFSATQPKFEISYDVDAPFAYRGKGFFKNLFGSFKMLSTGHIQQGLKRLMYCLIGGKDPFDNFYEILALLQEAEIEAHFFLLLEDKGEHNPSIHYQHFAFDILADKLARFQKVGIHPSYNCTTPTKLQEELGRFEKLLSFSAKKARAHFIQLKFPNTYELYLQNGIEEDFSMGFPEQPGFRAGIARPFPFYHLEKETQMNLIIHPFMAMDATFEYYLTDKSAEEIKLIVNNLMDVTFSYGGYFSIIFHNDILSGHLSSKDWWYLHEKIIWYSKQVLSNENV